MIVIVTVFISVSPLSIPLKMVKWESSQWLGKNTVWSIDLPFPKQALAFMCLQYKSFENNVGKGEIARNEQFLLFPVFSACLENFLPFASNLKLSSANSFSLEESKICRLGKS